MKPRLWSICFGAAGTDSWTFRTEIFQAVRAQDALAIQHQLCENECSGQNQPWPHWQKAQLKDVRPLSVFRFDPRLNGRVECVEHCSGATVSRF
jgi:hypothetical protein